MVWSIRAEYRARGPRQERAYDQIEMRLQFISRNVRSIERSNYQPRASRTWWRRVDGVRWTRYSPDDGEEETGKKRGTRPGSRLAWQEQTGSAYAAGDPGNSTIRLLVERVSRENWRERERWSGSGNRRMDHPGSKQASTKLLCTRAEEKKRGISQHELILSEVYPLVYLVSNDIISSRRLIG